MKLRAFHASDGDCLLLSSGDPAPRHILVDGGRRTSYRENTRTFLGDLAAANAKLDVICVSHFDDDHITELFWAAIEATEEAIVNSLIAAETMTGNGNTFHALPADRLMEIMARHGRGPAGQV